MPDHASDARGHTFRATITGIRLEGSRPAHTYITMAIRKVYADRDRLRLRAGSTIEVYSNPCDGFGLLGLDVNDEILISTAFLDAGDGPATWNTALWHVRGDRLRLAILQGPAYDRIWFTTDRRIASADTVREALALVAPDAIGMPDTATDRPRQSRSSSWLAPLVGLFFFLAVAVVAVRRLRRTGRGVPGWPDGASA